MVKWSGKVKIMNASLSSSNIPGNFYFRWFPKYFRCYLSLYPGNWVQVIIISNKIWHGNKNNICNIAPNGWKWWWYVIFDLSHSHSSICAPCIFFRCLTKTLPYGKIINKSTNKQLKATFTPRNYFFICFSEL